MRELEGFSKARVAALAAGLVVALSLGSALVAHAGIDDTMLVSRAGGPSGAAGAGHSGEELAVSSSGRYVAFVSQAGNFAPDAPVGVKSIYLRDVATNRLTLVSRATGIAGAPANADAISPAISPGGRYVAFESTADNLSNEDNDAFSNVYLRDTATDTTTLVSRASGASGEPGNGNSRDPAVSYNAEEVAFDSEATNLGADAVPGMKNVYMREAATQETKLISRTNPTFTSPDGDPGDGGQDNGGSSNPSISYDGQRIAFQSDATNLSTKDDDNVTDIFVRDLRTRSLFEVSCPSRVGLDRCPKVDQASSNGNSIEPSLSLDGGFVAFTSEATNLVPEEDQPDDDVFLRGLSSNATRLMSRAYGADGAPANFAAFAPTVSGEGQGQFVAFLSVATNLSEDTSPNLKVFVRDSLNSTTAMASRTSGATGTPADDNAIASGISGDGRFLAFGSDASNLSGEDQDGFADVFLRALNPAPPPPPEPLPEPVCHHPPCPDGGGGGHIEHGGAEHAEAGHGGAGHGAGGGHAHDESGPGQTLFAPGSQDVDRLYVMVQVHEASTLRVTARVNVPGSARVYSFKSFRRKLKIHSVRRVKLRLAPKALRSVKRALRQGRKLRARVTARALDEAGNAGIAKRTIRLRD